MRDAAVENVNSLCGTVGLTPGRPELTYAESGCWYSSPPLAPLPTFWESVPEFAGAPGHKASPFPISCWV